MICKICNKSFKRLTSSHLKSHQTTYFEYLSRFEKNGNLRTCAYQSDQTDWKCPNLLPQDLVSEYCVLHEKNTEGDQKKFQDELDSFIAMQQKNQSLESIHLDGIHFRCDYSLKQQTFTKKVSFCEAEFHGKFEIVDTKFEKRVDFRACKFRGEATFLRVTFADVAHFGNSVFCRIAKFRIAFFQIGVSFVEVKFEEGSKFDHCIINEFASFRLIKTPNESSVISFYFDQFPNTGRTWFENVDMSKVSFLECDLRFIKFINVQWAKPKWPSLRRKCLIDEFVNFRNGELTREHWASVRTAYQQLKWNFEESRNFSDAGDFYYGEMECRRKSQGVFRFFPTLNTLYWISSGYGERLIRAGFNLLMLLTAWIISLMILGLEPNHLNRQYDAIDYEMTINIQEFQKFAKDFLYVFTYVQEILLREEKPNRIFSPIVAHNRWINGDTVNVIGFVVIYLQLLLLALAVRRKFRR